jgi:hypothetical protein
MIHDLQVSFAPQLRRARGQPDRTLPRELRTLLGTNDPAYTRSRMQWRYLRNRVASYWQIIYLMGKYKCTTRCGLKVCAREMGESFRVCARPTQLKGSQPN